MAQHSPFFTLPQVCIDPSKKFFLAYRGQSCIAMFNLEASLIVLVVTQNVEGSEKKGWLLAVAACYQTTVKIFRYKYKLLCHRN